MELIDSGTRVKCCYLLEAKHLERHVSETEKAEQRTLEERGALA